MQTNNQSDCDLVHLPAFCFIVRIISHHCTTRGGCIVSNALEMMTGISCRPATNFLVCLVLLTHSASMIFISVHSCPNIHFAT
jgi:hypothetical protein